LPSEMKSCPYALFVFAGILPWMYFSTGVSTGGMALLNQQNLLTKVYFPRLFVPASTIGVAFFDAMISFGVMLAMMAIFRFVPPWTIVAIPVLAMMTTLLSLGMAFVLSSLTVTYRDFRFLVPFMVQSWMWLSPVGYPLHSVHHEWVNWLLRFNPMFGIINGFRSAMLGQYWDFASLGIALGETVICIIFGMYYFKKTERRFADIA
jgi:lipopolysaccharide transport system permease protein